MRPDVRPRVAVLGIAALAGGVLALLEVQGDFLGASAALFALGGVLGVAMTYLVYRDWSSTRSVEFPDVERQREFPSPGSEFDRMLSQFDGSGRGHLPDRQSIHQRLVEVGARLLAYTEQYSQEEATAAIENGEWPGDPEVAAFLEDPDGEESDSLGNQLLSKLGRDEPTSAFQRNVRRTVDDFADRIELLDFGPDAGDSTILLGSASATDEDQTGRRWSVDTESRSEDETDSGAISTGTWRGMTSIALALVGFGFLLQEATVVLAGTVAVGFGVYAEASRPVRVTPVVERSIGADNPSPGDEVEVTVTVRNESDRLVPDLAVVDGVPEGLPVTEGSPRHGMVLRPGASASYTYTVTARRGVHTFGPAYTAARDLAGTTARTRSLSVSEGSDTSLRCTLSPEAFPTTVSLHQQTGGLLGRMPAGGGEGIEFHSTREYRPGDSMSRIDWKHLARSAEDELTTVRFREERAATVAIVIDTYPVAYLANGSGDANAVDQALEAATRLTGSLLDDGDQVGVAALGETPLWISPDVGMDHRKRLAELLSVDDAFPPTPPESGEYHPRWVREFHRRYPSETQTILLSPLCDERYLFLVRRLQGFGHPVTIVSPDPTVDGTVGERLARIDRRMRIEALRESGVRVVDMDPSESLATAVSEASERWSQ